MSAVTSDATWPWPMSADCYLRCLLAVTNVCWLLVLPEIPPGCDQVTNICWLLPETPPGCGQRLLTVTWDSTRLWPTSADCYLRLHQAVANVCWLLPETPPGCDQRLLIVTWDSTRLWPTSANCYLSFIPPGCDQRLLTVTQDSTRLWPLSADCYLRFHQAVTNTWAATSWMKSASADLGRKSRAGSSSTISSFTTLRFTTGGSAQHSLCNLLLLQWLPHVHTIVICYCYHNFPICLPL